MHLTFLAKISGLAVVTLFASCSSAPQPPPRPAADEGLKQMAEVYRYIEYSKLPLPKKPEDFRDYWDSLQAAFDPIQAGEIVVVWGVGRATGPGAGQQILAYEKQSPTEGGTVLLRDGTVKQMTAAEFNAAPKAK